MTICYNCGTETEDTITIDDEEYCQDCVNELFAECERCGKYIKKEDAIETQDGDLICETCRNRYYEKCEDCGDIVRMSNLTYVESRGGYICQSCLEDNYTRCDDCGHFWRNYELRDVNGNDICDDCLENHYVTCYLCGEYVLDDNAYHDENADEYYCENCIRDIPIYDYHEFSDFNIHKTIEDTIDCLTLGFELEVSGSILKANKFLEFFTNQEIILMKDSSIENGGFEIITMPMSMTYFEGFKKRLEAGLNYLRENDFTSHNKGGMHIHINQDSISKDMLANLREVLYGNDNDINTWLSITQRHPKNQSQWCRMNGTNVLSFYNIKRTPSYEKIAIDYDRYTALNYSARTGTYEFRIFNGNLRIERVMKNIQCVLALLAYAKEHEDNERPLCNTTGFLKYVTENKEKYPDFAEFMEEKQIYENHIEHYFNEDTFDEEETEAA